MPAPGAAERSGAVRIGRGRTEPLCRRKEIRIETRSDVRGEGRCGTGPLTPQLGSGRSFSFIIIIVMMIIISALRVVYTILFSPISLLPLSTLSIHLSKLYFLKSLSENQNKTEGERKGRESFEAVMVGRIILALRTPLGFSLLTSVPLPRERDQSGELPSAQRPGQETQTDPYSFLPVPITETGTCL